MMCYNDNMTMITIAVTMTMMKMTITLTMNIVVMSMVGKMKIQPFGRDQAWQLTCNSIHILFFWSYNIYIFLDTFFRETFFSNTFPIHFFYSWHFFKTPDLAAGLQ